MKEKWNISMTNSFRTGVLLNHYEFLERLAVSCMGKKYIKSQGATLPSELKSTVKRVKAYSKLKNLLINYLVVNSSDKQLLLSLFTENETTLRYLNAQDFYFDSNKSANETYLTNVTIPLFVLRLSLMQSQMKEGFIKQLLMMLQASFCDYPKELKSYAKCIITNKATELGLTSKPIEWVGKIRSTSYPTINTFENSLLNWTESQLINESNTTQLIELTKVIYRTGLFVKALRELNNGFPSYQCVMDKQMKLCSSGANKHTYLNIMQAQLNHIDVATFLSTNKKIHGSEIAHQMLFKYNNCLFAPYYLQQQLKNQLNTEKKSAV